MIPTVHVRDGWQTVVEGTAREQLERGVLPNYLRAQRWFGGKGRRIEVVHFVDWGCLPATDKRVFAVLLEVRFADGNSDMYFMPLAVSGGENASRIQRAQQAWLIARLVGPEGEALLHDALADDDTCLSLIMTIGAKRELPMREGRIRAFPTAAFSSLAGDDVPKLSVERGPAKSSNTLIFFGKRLMLKLFRRLESGVNPEFEIGSFLTEGRLFQRVPHVGGAIEYHHGGSEPITLAILQSFAVNQGDGWQHALDQLGSYYERASGADATVPEHRPLLELADSDPPRAAVDAIGDYLNTAGLLGRRTAEMHRALAGGANNAAFAPEPWAPPDEDALRTSIRTRAENGLAALQENLDQLPQETASSARHLLVKAPDRMRKIGQAPLPRIDAVKIRCHGDYHLGQVLRVQDDYVIIDFEGEPMRTVAERRVKQSPLKDVAGMLRSYHVAAYAGLFASTQDHPDMFSRLQPKAELWYQWVSAAFLRAYRTGTSGEAFVPSDSTGFAKLLDAFMLEKLFYELHYELNNRPDWVRIPLHHILTLVSPSPEHQRP